MQSEEVREAYRKKKFEEEQKAFSEYFDTLHPFLAGVLLLGLFCSTKVFRQYEQIVLLLAIVITRADVCFAAIVRPTSGGSCKKRRRPSTRQKSRKQMNSVSRELSCVLPRSLLPYLIK